MAPLVHIVLLKFKEGVQAQQVNDIVQHFLSLKEKCVKADTGKPYLKSLRGGVNNSTEGLSHGHTHGFVIELENEEDREYYLKQDPAHQEFVKAVIQVAERPTVLDFSPGVM